MMVFNGKVAAAATAAAAVLLGAQQCASFQSCNSFVARRSTSRRGSASSALSATVAEESPPLKTSLDPEAVRLKDDLVALASATRRGFSASRSDRDKAKKLINDLSKYSPTDEPASAYYQNESNSADTSRSTLFGKWTLIYTDAPDITSLEGGPFSTAELGRIGQECNPPSIKNVIEWRRPSWASSLPFSGSDSSRVLQKVCCEGSATPDKPKEVDLKIVGLELSGMSGGDNNNDEGGSSALLNGPAAFFENNPVELKGPLTAPFGKFEVLYLDDGMRITQTSQGYYAVNVRCSEDNQWF